MKDQVGEPIPVQAALVVPEELPSREAVEFAVSLEDHGYEKAWLTEIVRDPFTRAATILARTERLTVATGVAQWSRGPIATAMAAAELHESSGGRFVLGVGTGTAHSSEHFHNIKWDRPALQMSDYIRGVRAAFRAHHEPATVESKYFPVSGFTQGYYDEMPPLAVAAVGPAMLGVAARHADAVIFNPATTRKHCASFTLPTFYAAVEKAGRERQDIIRVVVLRCAINDDRQVARQWARLSICEYGQYPVHEQVYGLNGFATAAAHIRSAMAEGDLDRAAAAVPDEMVDAFSICGTPDDARRQLSAWDGLVHQAAVLPTSYGMSLDEVRANCAAVRDAFARSAV